MVYIGRVDSSRGRSSGEERETRHFRILYPDYLLYANAAVAVFFTFGLAPKTLAAGTYHERSTSGSGEMDEERATLVGSPSSPVLASALRSQRLTLT